MEEELKGIKCMNAMYLGRPRNEDFDVHLVKYNKYYNNGRVEPIVALKKNFEKTFWVVNDRNRTYKQKRERMKKDNCDEYKVPRYKIIDTIKTALGQTFNSPKDYELLKSTYVHGTDLKSEAELKYLFNQHKLSRDFDALSSVAVFDVETNIYDKSKYNHITMATLSFGEKVITAVHRDYFEGKFTGSDEQIIQKLHELDDYYLKRVNAERNIKQEFVVVDTEWDILEKCFEKAHEWKPDFIVGWNITYDIERMIEAAQRARMSMADLLADPSVPNELRVFDFFPGRETFISKKGVRKNLSPEEKWPFVTCAASFVFIDAMCMYNKSRVHKGKLPKYKLDYILTVEFKEDEDPEKDKTYIRKLKFAEADQFPSDTPDWHIQMSKQFPFHYVIYNKFDCVSIEYLDAQTQDIAYALQSACEYSDYKAYDSEPKRLADEMHWDVQKKGYAFGTGGGDLANDLDDMCIGMNEWIITLRADLWITNGLRVMAEAPDLNTRITIHTADSDAVGSYPNSGSAMNTSRETCTGELVDIEGVEEFQRRMQGINLMGGFTNAVEFCENIYSAAPLVEVVRCHRVRNNKPHTNRLM